MEHYILLPSEQVFALLEARFIRIVDDSFESAPGLLTTIPARSDKNSEVAEVECVEGLNVSVLLTARNVVMLEKSHAIY